MDQLSMWVDINFVIKWTLKNAKWLEHDDTYYIEKETDNCMMALTNKKMADEERNKNGNV